MDKAKLKHPMFWQRIDRATRHVGKLPDWVKGSPINQRAENSRDSQLGTGTSKGDGISRTRAREGSFSPDSQF